MVTDSSPQKLLDRIEAYEEARYENIALAALVSFAIHWLEVQHIPTTFENIVVAAFKMFPAKFRLEGFHHYPDAACINRALVQVRPKYRNWARGTVKKGFLLTESGLKKVSEVGEILVTGASPGHKPVRTQRVPQQKTMDLSRDLQSVEQSTLFNKWRQQKLNEGSFLELLDMLGAYAYTPGRVLSQRLKFLEHAASEVGRNELVEFLRNVRNAFNRELGGS
jgi:hypothetical protein